MSELGHLTQSAGNRSWHRLPGSMGFKGGYSALLWLAITLLFLYERTYLIQKAGLPHFVACAGVRVGLLMGLCYAHIRLAERRLLRRKYVSYVLLTAGALAICLLLQGAYDQYLFGFVIGDQKRANLWQNLPYNLLATGWYLLLTYLVARRQPLINSELQKPGAEARTPGENEEKQEMVVIKTAGEWRHLPIASIRYVQGLKDYCVLHTSDGKHMVKGSIGKVAEWLPAGCFLRVHKSFLVARLHIRSVSSKEVHLDGTVIPIGRVYASELAFFKNQGGTPMG